ncbi:MAG: sigma-E processing peptidase SpoIIGA [Clostridiaceae bacterium]
MVIYLDVILFENFIVDFFLILLTGQITKLEIKYKNIFLASIIGSIYVLSIIYENLNFLTKMPFKIIIVLLMISIAFRNCELKLKIKTSLVYVLLSMALAGLCFFFKCSSIDNIYYFENLKKFSFKGLVLALMLVYVFIVKLVCFIKQRVCNNKLIYDIEVITEKEELKFKAFLDTGNNLTEPVTNLPVIIVDKKILNKFELDKEDLVKIPFKDVSGEGFLTAFKPKYIRIITKDRIYKEKAFIAMNKCDMDKNNEFQGLISLRILIDGGIIC